MLTRTGSVLAVLVLGATVSGCAQPALPQATDVSGYRVVYRIDDRAGPVPRVTTEVVEVRRPYDGRVEQRTRGRITSGKVTNRNDLWVLGSGGELQFGVRRTPGGPTRDASYGALRDAARAGVIDVAGAGEALRRRCTWFASGAPAPEPLTLPTAATRIETCVEGNGIVLEEVWRVGGRVARIVRAVELRTTPSSAERFLETKDPSFEPVGRPEAGKLLAGQIAVRDDVDPPLVPAIELAVPSPWQLDRRSVVSQAGTGGGPTAQGIAETYVNGSALVVVERSTHGSSVPSWQLDAGEPTDVGILGTGRIVYYADRVEVRFAGGSGYASVTAPSRTVAMSFARGLEPR